MISIREMKANSTTHLARPPQPGAGEPRAATWSPREVSRSRTRSVRTNVFGPPGANGAPMATAAIAELDSTVQVGTPIRVAAWVPPPR